MIDKNDRNSHTDLCDLLDVVVLTFIVSSARIGDTDVIPARVYESIEYNYMTFNEFKSYMEDVCGAVEIKESSVAIFVYTHDEAVPISKQVLGLELSEFVELMEQVGV